MEINFSDIKSICRTCFSTRYLKPITSITVQEGIGIADILIDFICREDIYNADLPQKICSPCVDQLNLYFKFKNTCIKNENILKSYLEQKSIGIKKCALKKQNERKDDFVYPDGYNDCYNSTSSNDDVPLVCILEKPVAKKKTFRKRSHKCKRLSSRNGKETTGLSINDLGKCSDSRNEKGYYFCKQCNKSFAFKYKLVMHMRVHTKEKPFKCDCCPLSFSLNGNLKRHKMIHTGEKPHVCKICGKGFIQATSLQIHSQKQHNEAVQQKFICKICGRVFVRSAPYALHLKKHHPTELTQKSTDESKDEEKAEENLKQAKFECEICGKQFGKLIFLKRHTSRHGEKKFLCSDCGKGFVRKADLQSHVKIHTGERPHKCLMCNKSFAHTGSLVTHSLVHSGYKPYSCSLCSKSFSQLSHLKIHKRTHSGERPYSCSFCGKTFALKSNMTVHIRTHTGETPYLCSVCGKGFYDSSSMKKHRLSHFNAPEKPADIEAEKQPEKLADTQ